MQQMRRHGYGEAATVLSLVPEPDEFGAMEARLVSNLASMRTHHEDLYQTVIRTEGPGPFEIVSGKHGLPSVARRDLNNELIALTQQNDPASALQDALGALREPCRKRECICLGGVGDGYLLSALAAMPGSANGEEQVIFVVEPDPRLLFAIMIIHDLAGDRGPFAQPRFQWFVGPQWEDALRRVAPEGDMMPFPAQVQCPGPVDAAIVDSLRQLSNERASRELQLVSEVRAYYERLDQAELASVFSDDPPRPPRALLITTRFSSVIQYSIRDTANALEELGWNCQVVIEPSNFHRILTLTLRQALAQFRPDAVFVIDHLRHEYGDIFPTQLPFVCWIQDHLLQLTNEEAGRRVGQRDFVLTSVAPMYTRVHGYPKRQCVDLPKLTRPRPTSRVRSAGDDLVYVSNASQRADDLVRDVAGLAGANAAVRKLIERCCERLIEVYRRGDSLTTMWHLRRLIDEVERQVGKLSDPRCRLQLLHLLNHPLNDTIYRQQALRWVASVARKRGLTLGLYGLGWEKHPEFAEYARGPIEYGDRLAELTCRTAINLQIVPSFCLHQRLLDGLMAGGFYLVRTAPADRLMPELAAFLEEHAPLAETVEEALAMISRSHRAALEELLRRAECLSELGGPIDLVEWIRCCRRSALLDSSGMALPHLGDVSFEDEAGFGRLLDRFMNDAEGRAEIAEAQRQSILDRLSYTAGVHRVIGRIGELLRSERAA